MLQHQKAEIAQEIAEKTISYLSIPAVVGYEHIFMAAIEADFKNLGLQVDRQDRYVAVSSGDNKQHPIISAHLDRHGLISLGGNEYVYAAQYIKEIKYGQNNRLAQKQLEDIARRFEGEGVFAYNPDSKEKLGVGVIGVCKPCMEGGDALFTIDDMPEIAAGIPLAYTRAAVYENDFLKGQIDNAISLAFVYYLFKSGFKGTALFTTEEEIGKSWLHIRDYLTTHAIETQNLLILDTSPYTEQSVIDDGNVIFRKRDMSGEFNVVLVDQLIERAKSLNIPFQVKDQEMLAKGKTIDQLGSTELGRLIDGSAGQWNGATVQIPTLMYHTSNETTTDVAIYNYFSYLKNILIDVPLEQLIKG